MTCISSLHSCAAARLLQVLWQMLQLQMSLLWVLYCLVVEAAEGDAEDEAEVVYQACLARVIRLHS